MINLLIYAILATAHADYAPGVWEQLEQSSPSAFTQMQEGKTHPIEGKIADVELRAPAVYLTVKRKNDLGVAVRETFKLCTEDADRWSTESERAMQINQRVQAMRDAKKSQESVRLLYRGPWSPCVTPQSF